MVSVPASVTPWAFLLLYETSSSRYGYGLTGSCGRGRRSNCDTSLTRLNTKGGLCPCPVNRGQIRADFALVDDVCLLHFDLERRTNPRDGSHRNPCLARVGAIDRPGEAIRRIDDVKHDPQLRRSGIDRTQP